jgi:hypothetical protein
MTTVSHIMETSDDFGRPVPFHAPGLSSTSGEGEGEAEKGLYNFTARWVHIHVLSYLLSTLRLCTWSLPSPFPVMLAPETRLY